MEGYVRLWCFIGGKIVEEKKEPATSETLQSGHSNSFWWITHGNEKEMKRLKSVSGIHLELGLSLSLLDLLQYAGVKKHLQRDTFWSSGGTPGP